MTEHRRARAAENPRTTRVRDLVLDEGLRLLVEEGGEAVTALRIAEATNVARSTIYRHWSDQPSLLYDVVERGVAPHGSSERTGDLEADLESALRGLRSRLDKRAFRRVFAALLTQADSDDAFVGSQQRLLDGVMAGVRGVLADAVSDGRLPESLDVDEACAQLAGPLLTQHVMVRRPIADELISGVVAAFIALRSARSGEG